MGYSKEGDSTADLRCTLVTFLAFGWRKLVVCCEYIAKASSDSQEDIRLDAEVGRSDYE